jgi:hypothetical protein
LVQLLLSACLPLHELQAHGLLLYLLLCGVLHHWLVQQRVQPKLLLVTLLPAAAWAEACSSSR